MGFSGKNTGVGFHALLQMMPLTQRSNLSFLGVLHWQEGSLPPAPPGKPNDDHKYVKYMTEFWLLKTAKGEIHIFEVNSLCISIQKIEYNMYLSQMFRYTIIK